MGTLKSGIYKIENIVNGKLYIGSSHDLNERRINHFSMLRNNTHHSIHLQNSVNKHGIDKFIFEIIEYCDLDIMLEREEFYLKELLGAGKCLDGDCDEFLAKGYNIKPSAISGFKGMHSKETLIKIQRKMGFSSVYKVNLEGVILGEYDLVSLAPDRCYSVYRSIKKQQTLRDKDYGYIYSKDYVEGYKPESLTIWNKGKSYMTDKNASSKPVFVYDCYGRFIEQLDSLIMTARKYNMDSPNIIAKLNKPKGSKFCFMEQETDFYNLKEFDKEIGDNDIEVFTVFDESLGYSTVQKASKTINSTQTGIKNVLNGLRKQCYRYKFKYIK